MILFLRIDEETAVSIAEEDRDCEAGTKDGDDTVVILSSVGRKGQVSERV